MENRTLVSSDGTPIQIKSYLPTVLIAEDSELNVELLEEILKNEFNLPVAKNGEDAWHIIQTNADILDAILLDRMMPRLSGDEILERMKENVRLEAIPVIFQTARISHQDILEGMALGANYYVTKPYERDQLIATLRAAIREYHVYKKAKGALDSASQALEAFSFLTYGKLSFSFHNLTQAQQISSLLANACEDPKRALLGLMELTTNAVEHGIAGIGYDEKTMLNINRSWYKEVQRRLSLPSNIHKYATITMEVHHTDNQIDYIQYQIEDPGNGFDHEKYRVIDQERVFDNHGRGIAMGAGLVFDELIYNEKGNQVTAIVKVKDKNFYLNNQIVANS